MRRLLYVPILHSETDLGSAGAAMTQLSVAIAGERRWKLHLETMDRFWDSLAAYFRTLRGDQLKVYQDGLPAEGQAARRVIEEAAHRGSRNYQLLLELVLQGAEPRTTEAPWLLAQERAEVLRRVQPEAAAGRVSQPGLSPPRSHDELLGQRDVFIAEAIGATLEEGETGVLFLGAYHAAPSQLPDDVTVVTLKERSKVIAYFHELLGGKDQGRLAELARYLVSPVNSVYQGTQNAVSDANCHTNSAPTWR